jgi:hypothetical protein
MSQSNMSGWKSSLSGRMRKALFGLSTQEARFERRGFQPCALHAQRGLEQIGAIFLQGYHSALEGEGFEDLAVRLNRTPLESRGFAFEGAAMGLSLLDLLTPWNRDRWQRFTASFAKPHIYMMHVGVGWAFARLGRRLNTMLARLDPLLCWLAVDGYGFHEGYFHWPRFIDKHVVPACLSGYARRAFDQGLGRSLWFVNGADVQKIPRTIASFHPARRADLWSGIGLACAYAGGVERASLEALREAAAGYRGHLAQGAAFAAKTRQRAGNPAPCTEQACQVICDLSAEAAAEVSDIHLENLPRNEQVPAYEVWRQRIQTNLGEGAARACLYA